MIKQPKEEALQALAMKCEEGPMDGIVQHFEGWPNILREADDFTGREKVQARRFLTWTVVTPAERELLNLHRNPFGTA